ncbi:MAG TPA: hypothetical protein VKO20_01060, partial [Desulfosalsimonadaceae bacterium]|nr:hypothetical protein [Desulfosalsimonadaceae bacterium]
VLPMLPVMIGAAGIFLTGLTDDIFELNPQYKLIFQVVIASALVFFGIQVHWFEARTVNIVVSIFWIVGITNAFNLLDNMDGLSAGIAFISGFFLFLWLSVFPDAHFLAEQSRLLLSVFLGGILGFLVYNFNPASIFMGDAGSLLIGFLLACLAITEPPPSAEGGAVFNQIFVVAIPCFILFIPILDTVFVSLMRKLVSRSIFQGGLDHSSHRMVAVGLSEPKAVAVLYGFAAVSGLIALGIYPLNAYVSVVIIAAYLLFIILFWVYLAKVKVYPAEEAAAGNSSPYFILALGNDGYVRTLLVIVLDLILIAMAYYISYLLRFEGSIGPNFKFFLKSLPILFAAQIFSLFVFGVYQRLWQGSRLTDLSVYVKAVTSGTVASMLILLFLYRFQSFSRAVFVIYWGLMLSFLLFSRFFFRMLDEWICIGSRNGTPVLVYGAGTGGQMLVREIESNTGLGLTIVGFIDDDPHKKGKRFYGYPVFGGGEQIAKTINKHNIKEVIVSFQAGGEEKKKELHQVCARAGCDVAVRQMRLVIS